MSLLERIKDWWTRGDAAPPDPLGWMMDILPSGSTFLYLGQPCVALYYADAGNFLHGNGYIGLVYEYVDLQGRIHERCATPREFGSFMHAVEAIKKPEQS